MTTSELNSTLSSLGLTTKDYEVIVNILQSYPKVIKATVFGSRAKGVFRTGSDVDIALFGEELDLPDIIHLSYLLNEETPLPYKFDLLNFNQINEENLIEHINRVGKVIFERETLHIIK